MRSGSRPGPARALTKKELNEFRRVLEAERDRLTEELEAIEEHLPEVEQVSMDTTGGYDEDLADVASDAFEREKGFAIESSVQELLNQVEEALTRIDEGTYGLCEVCGQPIHPERLRALPYARLCIECKAREEPSGPGRRCLGRRRWSPAPISGRRLWWHARSPKDRACPSWAASSV
jgi:RNA polymerase-binding protein DksA